MARPIGNVPFFGWDGGMEGIIFVERHKSGQSYPFLNESGGACFKKIKKNFDIQIIVFIFAVV